VLININNGEHKYLSSNTQDFLKVTRNRISLRRKSTFRNTHSPMQKFWARSSQLFRHIRKTGLLFPAVNRHQKLSAWGAPYTDSSSPLISQQNKSIFLAPKKYPHEMHLKGPKAYILISLKRYYIPLCKMEDAGELQAISRDGIFSRPTIFF
jgi:hypothetical protein